MDKIYLKDNYIVTELGGITTVFGKNYTVYSENTTTFFLNSSFPINNARSVTIDFSRSSSIYNEAGTVAYTTATLRSFFLTNTGFKSPSGGSGGVWGSITGTLSSQTDLQNALDAKQDDLVSGTNIKTINGSSVLGSGDLTISGSGLKGIHAINTINSGDQVSASLQSATSGTGGNFSANRLLAYPFIPNQSFTSSNLQINVTVLGVGSLCRIAVYTDLNGNPDTSLFISSNLDCSTTGLKTVTASINFVAGTTYWMAFHSGTAAAVTQLLVAQMFPLKYANINALANYVWRSLNFSTPTPTTFGGGNSFTAGNVPAIIITKA